MDENHIDNMRPFFPRWPYFDGLSDGESDGALDTVGEDDGRGFLPTFSNSRNPPEESSRPTSASGIGEATVGGITHPITAKARIAILVLRQQLSTFMVYL